MFRSRPFCSGLRRRTTRWIGVRRICFWPDTEPSTRRRQDGRTSAIFRWDTTCTTGSILGRPGLPTLYGTETGLKQFASTLHRFDGRLQIDAVYNHNAYSDDDYANRNNPSSQYYQFRQAGGYPGFTLENPDGGTDPAGVPGTFGDFHDPAFGGDYLNGQLSGLLDIGHPVQLADGHQLIRHPVAAGNPQNIPAGVTAWAGRLANVPDAANARFYPDRDGPSVTYFDPSTGQNETIYSFNSGEPHGGRCHCGECHRAHATEHAVDGASDRRGWFSVGCREAHGALRLRHMDAAVYRSNPRLLLDGSVDHVFMYGEVVPGDGQPPGQSQQDFLYSYIRKDINPGTPNTIGGNRDVIDFPLRGELSGNLQNSGVGNNWNNVVNSSMDVRDDGLSQRFGRCRDRQQSRWRRRRK